jgi:hypothetical protein
VQRQASAQQPCARPELPASVWELTLSK